MSTIAALGYQRAPRSIVLNALRSVLRIALIVKAAHRDAFIQAAKIRNYDA